MKILKPKTFNLTPSSGQTFLALIFLIGGIIIVVGVTFAYITLSSINSSYGYQASESAEAAATAGAEDALLQLNRYNGFPSGGPNPYTIQVGSSTATVTITDNSPSSGYVTVLSVATVSGRTRKLQLILSELGAGEEPVLLSWQEIP